MTEQWLSIAEYARHFDISDMTVRRRIKNGKLQAVLREGKYFIPVSSSASPDNYQHNSPVSNRHPEASPRGSHETISARHGTYIPEQRNRVSYPENRTRNTHQNTHNQFARRQERNRQSWGEPYAERQPGPGPGYRTGHQIVSEPPAAPLPVDKENDPAKDNHHIMKICEKMLVKLEEAEKNLKNLAEAREATLNEKIKTLEEQATSRNEKLKRLMQKNEDMQLLIKMLEKKELAP